MKTKMRSTISSNAHVAERRRVGEVALHAGDLELTRHEAHDGVSKADVALGVLEVDGVHLVRHRGRADLALDCALLEVSHRDVHPHVAVEVEKHRVPARYRVKKLCDSVMAFDLRRQPVLPKAD